jgi:hypothetical protein
MKSFTCLVVVLMAVLPSPLFSEELGYSAETSLEAAFSFQVEVPTYNLTASSSDGGSVSPASVTVLSGGSQTFTATPDPGHMVDKWYMGSIKFHEGGTICTISNVQYDLWIYVTFKKAEYTIVATSGANGSIRPTFSVISPGGNEQYVAIPNIGYKVDMWYMDDGLAKIGGTNFQLTDIQADHTVHVTFRKALAYSLDNIEFEDEQEFKDRIVSNNTTPDEPDKAMVFIRRIVGVEIDPDNVVMGMRSQKDLDPASPNYGQMVNARAKGIFTKTDVDTLLIRFSYLFVSSEPGMELVVYISDMPGLLAPDNPLRKEHSIEVARLLPPPFPHPGSAGSSYFAVFQKVIWTGNLNFSEGVYIELELIEPDKSGLLFAGSIPKVSDDSGDSSVFIDDLSPAVQCYGICLDINWDNFVDEADFLMVIGGSGCSATGEMACMDGAFSSDGYMDSYDVASWDWALDSEDRLLNYCGIPLIRGGMTTMSVASAGIENSDRTAPRVNFAGGDLSDILIAGKTSENNASSKLKDSLYIFNSDGRYGGSFEPASDRCNIRLIQGADGENYQLNSETGLLRLDSANTVIIPPGELRLTGITEPRYNRSATVYVGIQDEGPDSFGRPVLDAAFDADYVYVVPVVVNPDGEDAYTAAAKLRLLDGVNTPYEVVQLYDDPPLPNDNQYRNNLRELEVDSAGNLYVLNVHAINQSDILWRYKPDGTVERLDLGIPDSNCCVPAPIGMYMSETTDMLYLSSAANNPEDSNSTVIYGLSTKGTMALKRFVTINGLQHVTSIAEDPQTGTLWIAGFNMYDIPLYPNPYLPAFYYPYLVKISNDGDNIEYLSLYDPSSHDLALPMSILWTGSTGHD